MAVGDEVEGAGVEGGVHPIEYVLLSDDNNGGSGGGMYVCVSVCACVPCVW